MPMDAICCWQLLLLLLWVVCLRNSITTMRAKDVNVIAHADDTIITTTTISVNLKRSVCFFTINHFGAMPK